MCIRDSYEAQSGAGEVHTGGIHLFVSDEAGQPLGGAAFRLVRAEDEWKEETESSATYVNFLTGSGGKPVSEVTTGEDGKAFLWGVAYGRYYLVQTKAPDGKDKLSQPAAVTVSASSHLTAQDGWQDARGMTVDNTVNLVNREETLQMCIRDSLRAYRNRLAYPHLRQSSSAAFFLAKP